MADNLVLRNLPEEVNKCLKWGRDFYDYKQNTDVARKMITHYPSLYQQSLELRQELEALKSRLREIRAAHIHILTSKDDLNRLLSNDKLDKADWVIYEPSKAAK